MTPPAALNALPNALTLARIALVAFVLAALIAIALGHDLARWVLPAVPIAYGIAAITDFFDGILARALNATSEWGKRWDALADKLAAAPVALAFVFAAQPNAGTALTLLPVVVLCAVLILMRDVGISLWRAKTAKAGAWAPPAFLAKVKTTLEFLAVTGFLTWLTVYRSEALLIGAAIVFAIAMLASLWTGWRYISAAPYVSED